ncbi:MAG: hypothetical protein Sapg2KO_05540 [Saprospiraceae bacterium]
MLKFFRKIRQRLLNQGKLRRYLVYAIGEIFLVVIGILIALQINNWNELKKLHQTELETLIDLKNEFQENYAVFQAHFEEKIQFEAQWEVLLTKLSNENLAEAERPNRMIPPGGSTLNISFGILNAILNSGKINIIRNSELKKALANWNGTFDAYSEEELIHREFIRNKLNGNEPYITPYPILRNGERPKYIFHESIEVEQYYQKAFQDMRFQNVLKYNYNMLYETVQEGEELNSAFKELMTLLEEEIERLQ